MRNMVVAGLTLWWVAALQAARSAPMLEGVPRVSNDEEVVLLEVPFGGEPAASHEGDCLVGEWGAPGACSADCGGGLRTYRRAVLKAQKKGGAPCPKLIKASVCNVEVCSEGPEEKEEKAAKKKEELAKHQKQDRAAYFAQREKKVLAAQDTSRKALTEALEDGRAGLKAHNDVAYVNLVNAVSGELKAYNNDKLKRDGFIEKQVMAKRELFEKHVIDSVHGMKYRLMDKAHNFAHNPMYEDKNFDATNKIAASKETTHKQNTIERYKKEIAVKVKAVKASAEPSAPFLGESSHTSGLSGVKELSAGPLYPDGGLSKPSLRCGMCLRSCKTIKCESWCHQHLCIDNARPAEYLDSWPGVTLGSTAKQEPIDEGQDPDEPSPAQHKADEKATKREVFDRQNKPDEDAPSFKQHEQDEKEAESAVQQSLQKRAEKKQERAVKERERLTEQMQKKEAEKEAEQAEDRKEDKKAKDALADDLIEMDLKRDFAKEKKKKKATKTGGMSARERDLQRLREQEAEAKELIDGQKDQLNALATLDGEKKKVAKDIKKSNQDVEELKLQQAAIRDKKATLLAQAKYQEMAAEADGMHSDITTEKSFKTREKEARFKEREHKGSKITQLEKSNKYTKKVHKESVGKLTMEEQASKYEAHEAQAKLKEAMRIQQLTDKARQVEKSNSKIDEAAENQESQAQADAAMQALMQAKARAYKAQRHAATVAKKIAEVTPTPEGSVAIQAQADADANRARHDYEQAQADAKEAVKDIPNTESPEGEMADAKKAGKTAAQKAKAEALKAFAEKKLCKKLEQEAEVACSGGGKGDGKADGKGGGKGDAKTDGKVEGKTDGKGEGKTDGKGKGKTDEKTPSLLGESKKDGKENGVSKVCKMATKTAEKQCKKVKKAMNEAEAGAMQAAQRKAYIAQMYAAQVAQKEAAGQATMLQVAQADEAAKELLKKSNEIPSLENAGKGKKFSAAEVKKIVAAEVNKVLDKAKLAKNSTNSTGCANKTKGEGNTANTEAVKELKKEVDEDVKADVEEQGSAMKQEAKEKGQKANAKEKKTKKTLKKKASKEGKAKEKAQKIIDVRVKKAAAVLNKAHKAQLNAAKMAKMRHDDMESVSEEQVTKADEAADKAKEAAEQQAEVTALAVQCKAGHGKLLKLEKKLAEVSAGGNKAMKEFIEGQVVQMTQEIHTACKQEKKGNKKAAESEKEAAKEEGKAEKELKKAESKAEAKKEEAETAKIGKEGGKEGGKGSGSGSSAGPKKMEWEVVVEHGAITATFNPDPDTAAAVAAAAGSASPGQNATVDSEPEEPKNAEDFSLSISNGTITSVINYTHPGEMVRTKKEVTAEEIDRIRKHHAGLQTPAKGSGDAPKNGTGRGSGAGSSASVLELREGR